MKTKLVRIISFILILTICISASTLFLSAESNSDSLTETDTEQAEKENLFSSVFNYIKDSAAEIFSALALISSLILAYAYKKGLYPLLKNALNALNGSVSRLKETADNELKENGSISKAVNERLSDFEGLLDASADKLNSLEEKLTESKGKESERLKTVLCAQIDMLYDVFMSSSLPQYQKDAIGQRVLKMREELGENEGA